MYPAAPLKAVSGAHLVPLMKMEKLDLTINKKEPHEKQQEIYQ